MRTRRLVVLLTAVAVVGLALSASSGAVPRQRAVAAALAALRPQKAKTPVIVYGLPAPLPAGSDVVEAGPTGNLRLKQRSSPTTTVRSWRLKRKAWLFWEDLEPGAGFVHPSRLVLVDDATAKVTVSAALAWWPLVAGKLPAFVRRPSDRRYQVYSRTATRSLATRPRALLSTRVPARGAFTGEHDCYVYAAALEDDSNPTFKNDNAAMLNWAEKRKLPHPAENAADAETLAEQIEALTAKGCTDVVIFLRGHGLAPPGAPPPLVTSDVAAVQVSSRVQKAGGGWRVKQSFISSADIANIVSGYVGETADGKTFARVHFKLIVDSCFSGRFVDDLAPLQAVDVDHPDPPIRVIAASSASNRLTHDSYLAAPTPKSHWITELVQAFDQVANDKDLNATINGDLAAVIDAAAGLAKESGDSLVQMNNPQNSLSSGNHPIGEPLTPAQRPDVRPVHATFTQSARQTTYSIFASPAPLTYSWTLHPPADPRGCNNGGKTSSTAPTFTWYHGDDVCTHEIEDPVRGHKGTIEVTLVFPGVECHTSIYGTNDGDGTPPMCQLT